jgi:hypothetical protein
MEAKQDLFKLVDVEVGRSHDLCRFKIRASDRSIAKNMTGVFTKNWHCAEDALHDTSTPNPIGEVIITRGGSPGK